MGSADEEYVPPKYRKSTAEHDSKPAKPTDHTAHPSTQRNTKLSVTTANRSSTKSELFEHPNLTKKDKKIIKEMQGFGILELEPDLKAAVWDIQYGGGVSSFAYGVKLR